MFTIAGRTYRDLGELRARVAELDAEHAGSEFPDDARSEWNEINAAIDELEARTARIHELARNPRAREAGASFHTPRPAAPPDGPAGQARDEGLRAIDRMDLSAEAGDRLVDLVERDRSGVDARYLAAVAEPDYERAFWKRLAHGPDASHYYTDREAQATRRVVQAMEARSMIEGVGAQGGFGVPYALDPTIVLSSSGSTNPLRRLARVTTVTTNEWRGVTSDGVVASMAAEEAEVGDNSPALVQPIIPVRKAHAFVPFSIEVGQDYAGFQQELADLFADARDQLEASQMTTGSGVAPNVQGIITGATNVVTTAGTAVFAVADLYSTQEAVPPRFSPAASWLSTNPTANRVYRFAGGGSVEPEPFNDDRTRLLGKPWNELSNMASAITTGNLILVYGDIRAGYRIVDRIGLSVELINHLFGASRRPTGQRGLYAWWRFGGQVTVPNALRVTKIR